jgi:hypothetical protein
MTNGSIKFKVTGRGFLNNMLGDKTAYISWGSDIDKCEHDFDCTNCADKTLCSTYRMKRIDAGIELKDCNNCIKFDFDISGETSETETYIKNNLYKINRLIREFKKFKKTYIEQIELMKKNVDGLNKKKIKRSKKK